MDDKLFKQKLSQVAEWRIPETMTSTQSGDAKSPPRRGRPSNEDLFMEENEERFLAEHGGVNPTFPPQVLKVKCQAQTCGDCGKFCENGRHTEKKHYVTNNIRHWRERCVTCGLHYNPYTQQYDLNKSRASTVWNGFLRDSKGSYKTKANQARQQFKNNATVVYEDLSQRITIPHENIPEE